MWVLILSFTVMSSQSGVAVTTQEFTSKERCQVAGSMFIKNLAATSEQRPAPRAICVPK